MFKLQVPGSFPLCVDARFQSDAVRDLERVSTIVRQSTTRLGAVGLILTGSVSRGEGTLIADADVGSRWLGDLECLVVVQPQRRGSYQRHESLLKDVERRLNSDFRSRGLKIGLPMIVNDHLKGLRRSIFNLEFLEHGKLLWGAPASLPVPNWWAAGNRDVPVRDALRLLNNRTIQQVAARMAQETGAADPFAGEYSISKFWIELATSLSVFLGCYRTTYRDRQAAIEHTLAGRPNIFGSDFNQLLTTRLREAMAVKFGETPSYSGSIHQQERFREVAAAACRIWYWETGRLLDAEVDSMNWQAVIGRLRRLEPTSQRTRDWLRFLLRYPTVRTMTPDTIRTIRGAFVAGSLANLIYASGCLLLFYWNEIGAEIGPGPQIVRTLKAFFDIQAGSGKESRLILTEKVRMAWERHLRFSPA